MNRKLILGILLIFLLGTVSPVLNNKISTDGVEVDRKWDDGGAAYTSLATTENEVIGLSTDGAVDAFGKDGLELWSKTYEGPLTLEGSRAYYNKIEETGHRDESYLVSKGTESESNNWEDQLEGEIRQIDSEADKVVYGNEFDSLVAYSTSGNRQWFNSETFSDTINSIEVESDMILAGDNNGKMAVLNPVNGEEIWNGSFEGPVRDLEVENNKIYVATRKKVHIFDTNGNRAGMEEYEVEGDYLPHYIIITDIEVEGQKITLATDSGNIIRIDTKIQREVWNFKDQEFSGPEDIEVEGNTVYVGYLGGDIVSYSFKPSNENPGFYGVDVEVSESQGRVFKLSTNAEADNVIKDIKWSFGDGTEKEGRTVVKEFPYSGSWEINLTVIDEVGTEENVTKEIEVPEGSGLPDASIVLQDEYIMGEEGEIELRSQEAGKYRVDVEGVGVDSSKEFENEENNGVVKQSMNIMPEGRIKGLEGELQVNLTAPKSGWRGVIGVLPGVEDDKLLESKIVPVREVAGKPPQVSFEGPNEIEPDVQRGEVEYGETDIEANLQTFSEKQGSNPSIADWNWNIIGLGTNDEGINADQKGVHLNWEKIRDSPSEKSGLYIFNYTATDEYGRTSQEVGHSLRVGDLGIEKVRVSDDKSEVYVEATVNSEIASSGYIINLFGVDTSTSDVNKTIYNKKHVNVSLDIPGSGRYKIFLRGQPDGTGYTLDESSFAVGENLPTGNPEMKVKKIVPNRIGYPDFELDVRLNNTGEHGEDTVEVYVSEKIAGSKIVELNEGEEKVVTIEDSLVRSLHGEPGSGRPIRVETDDGSASSTISIVSSENHGEESVLNSVQFKDKRLKPTQESVGFVIDYEKEISSGDLEVSTSYEEAEVSFDGSEQGVVGLTEVDLVADGKDLLIEVSYEGETVSDSIPVKYAGHYDDSDKGDDKNEDKEDSRDNSRPAWESKCISMGYGTTYRSKQACIEEQLVPKCFEGSTEDGCSEIGQSLCQDLLVYDYNAEEARCVS